MTNVETVITQAVQKNAPYAVDMITTWINTAMLGNHHIVKEISHCRFTFKTNESMRFTAKLVLLTGRDFDLEVLAKFIWTKKVSKLQATFKTIPTQAKI